MFIIPYHVTLRVMLRLIFDVGTHLCEIRFRDRKGAIPSLPFEWRFRIQLLVDEVRGGSFHVLDQFRDRRLRIDGNKKVDVILNPADSEEIAFEFFDLFPNQGENPFVKSDVKDWFAIPCPPDEVDEDFPFHV